MEDTYVVMVVHTYVTRYSYYITVTRFMKSYTHASNFATFMSHNIVCDYIITLQISPTLI